MEMKKMNFEQMENVEGGMGCGWAIGGMVLAGGVFAFATAGWGTLLINGAGLGYAFVGYVESCYAG